MMVNYQHSQQRPSSTTPPPSELYHKLNFQNSDNKQEEKPNEYETFKQTNNINDCISASSTNIKSSGIKLRSNKILESSLSVLSSDSISNLSSKVETEDSTSHCPANTLTSSTSLISSNARTESRPKIAIIVNGNNNNSHYSSSEKSNQNLNPKSTNGLPGDENDYHEQTNHHDHNHGHNQNNNHHYSQDLVIIKNKELSPPPPFQNHNHLKVKNKKIRIIRSRTDIVDSTEPEHCSLANLIEQNFPKQLETKIEQKQEDLNKIQSSNNANIAPKTLNNHQTITPAPKQRRRLKRPIWNNSKVINSENQKVNDDSTKNNQLENESIPEPTNKLVNDLSQTNEINHNHEIIDNDSLYDNVQINNYQDLLRSSPMNISYDSDDTNSLTSTLSSNTLTPPLSYSGSGYTTTNTTMMITRNPIGLTPIAASLKSFCSTPIPPVTYDPNGYGVIEQPEQIEPAREPDDEPNKIFVGGLPWDTTEYDLEFYFSHFGKVTEINIKYDPLSCLTRGFCFVTFELEETVNLILKKPIHMIKGKMIELKRAKYRPICKKVFVGGLDPQITENDLKSYFSQYGTVIAIETPKDRLRNRKREFCFIIFESEFSAERACLYPKQFIGQRLCDVKKAQPQPICYQQKRMAQTLGLEISSTHLNKILLGESGRATIPTPNGASPASAIDCTATGTEALCPLAVAPTGALFYYQPMAAGGNNNVTGSSSLAARVIPMATRPAVIGYPQHNAYHHHHHHQHQIIQSIPAPPPPPPPPAPPPTQSSSTAATVTSQQNHHSHHHHSYENSVASDYYVNYYAQTAAYYATQQQQQNQLSITTTSTQHQNHCWNNASSTTTINNQLNTHQTLSSSSSSSSSNQVTSTNITPTDGKTVEENNVNINDKNDQCTIESSNNTDNDKTSSNTINNSVTIIGKPTFNHNHHLLLMIGENSTKNRTNQDNI